MTTKDLKCYINLVDRVAVGFESTDSNSERTYSVGKMILNSIAQYRETMWQTSLLF